MLSGKIKEMPKFSQKDVSTLKNAKSLEVGFFENATYPSGASVASVAFWNDMGTRKMPPRPFFRNTFEQQKNSWGKMLRQALYKSQNTRQGFGMLGERARSDVIANINKLTTPPLAESTIKAKGSSKPLIDTGLMRRSVTYRVK